jgi:transcriptional regulator with XRE-family HTH domain
MNHPSVVKPSVALGQWLREKRRALKLSARVFAERISLTHAQYAEAELGVFKWLASKQQALIPLTLDLNPFEIECFKKLTEEAEASAPLSFSNLFSRDELRPVRAFHLQGKQLTKADEERLLDAVFAPLA